VTKHNKITEIMEASVHGDRFDLLKKSRTSYSKYIPFSCLSNRSKLVRTPHDPSLSHDLGKSVSMDCFTLHHPMTTFFLEKWSNKEDPRYLNSPSL